MERGRDEKEMKRRNDYTSGKEKRGNKGGKLLLSTTYKIYTSILSNRLKKKIEEKSLMPESQAAFRKGRGVIDNIYCLNYLVGREVGRGRKIGLADLKLSF